MRGHHPPDIPERVFNSPHAAAASWRKTDPHILRQPADHDQPAPLARGVFRQSHFDVSRLPPRRTAAAYLRDCAIRFSANAQSESESGNLSDRHFRRRKKHHGRTHAQLPPYSLEYTYSHQKGRRECCLDGARICQLRRIAARTRQLQRCQTFPPRLRQIGAASFDRCSKRAARQTSRDDNQLLDGSF